VSLYLFLTDFQRTQQCLQHVGVGFIQFAEIPFLLLHPELVAAEVALYDDRQFVRTPGFDQIVADPAIQDVSHDLHGIITGHHHNGDFWMLLMQMFEESFTPHAGHVQVGQADIHSPLRQNL
jgi:hypothetical protein